MPIYTYICPNCQNKQDEIRPVDKRHYSVICNECDFPFMEKAISNKPIFKIDGEGVYKKGWSH